MITEKQNQDVKYSFTETEVKNFVAFSDIIKKIHIRLINEGFAIKDGQIIDPAKLSVGPKSDTIK